MNGFSLVELVGAAVILGVLLGLGFMQYLRVIERAKAGPVIHYLTTLRATQQNYRRADLERSQIQRSYAGNLLDLDVALPDSISGWGRVDLSSPGDTGMATFQRTRGWYKDQQLGIQYGSGTFCGTFEPLASLISQVACAAD